MMEERQEGGRENMKSAVADRKETAPGLFRLSDFEESPYHRRLAETLLGETQRLYASLVERAECHAALIDSIDGFFGRIKVAKVDDSEFLDALRLLEADLEEPASKAVIAKKVECDICPAVSGADAGISPKYYGRQFSLWNRAKAAFGNDRVRRLQLQMNERARSAAQESFSENILLVRRRLGEMRDDTANAVPERTELLELIAAAETKVDAERVGRIFDEIVRSRAKQELLSTLISRLASRFGMEKNALYPLYSLYPDRSRLEMAIKENARNVQRKATDLVRVFNGFSHQFPVSHAVSEESLLLVDRINDLLLSGEFDGLRDRVFLDKEVLAESSEISRGRVLTHSAPFETMLEILRDGALLSVEAQAREKGRAKRTHGIALVKKDYMEDRHSPESHSLAFGVDRVYGNFVQLKDIAPVVIALPENHFLSMGYLFQESDGEHLFDPSYNGTKEGAALRMDLRDAPFIFLVAPDRLPDIRKFLLEESAWSGELSAMGAEERENWFSMKVIPFDASYGRLPDEVKAALEAQSGPPISGYSGIVETKASFKGWYGNVKRFFPKEKHYE